MIKFSIQLKYCFQCWPKYHTKFRLLRIISYQAMTEVDSEHHLGKGETAKIFEIGDLDFCFGRTPKNSLNFQWGGGGEKFKNVLKW